MANLMDLMADIRSNSLKPFYIFIGDEIGLMNVYLGNIQPSVIRESSVLVTLPSLTQRSLISENKVYAVRDDKEFLANDSRWKRLEDIRYGTLILMYTKIDGRSKFLKQFEDIVITFDRMTSSQLLNHFAKSVNFPTPLLEQIIELCDRDYSRIANELDKLNRVSLPTETAVNEIVHRDVEFQVFEAVDSVIRYEPIIAFEYLEILLATQDNVLGFLTLLYTQFSAAARILGSSDAKESTINVKQFTINKIKSNFNYSLYSAFKGMTIIGDIIEGIKSGLYTDTLAVQICLLKIFELS